VRKDELLPKFIVKYKNLGWEWIGAAKKSAQGRVIAASTEYFETFNYEAYDGGLFTSSDYKRARPCCMVGQKLASNLFGTQDNIIGEEIEINSIRLMIIGVIQTDNLHARRARELVFPFSVYSRLKKGTTRDLDEVTLVVTENKVCTRKLCEWLTNRLTASHRGVADFHISRNSDKIERMEASARGLKVLLLTVAIITLAVGGISIVNVTLASVNERVREIGLRKSLGADRIDIFGQFLLEAILACVLGALPGILLGSVFLRMSHANLPYQCSIMPRDYLIVALYTMLVGIGSGVFPALVASRMQPKACLDM